jgi:FAD/FMN-containing dehydrogenase
MTTTAARLDGHLLLPGDHGYDRHRAVWNAMVDRRPRMIIRAAGVADVQTAIRTARELGVDLGVKCGGHSAAGWAVPEDGVMLDLTLLDQVRVDPARRRAYVAGGALLGALDVAAQRHGLATTAGNVSHTGVGGLTLGGGMGWLARQYGLACDNVESYQVVTATGDLVRASREEHPELFWALRGGGGNFGVVTGFEFRLHATGTRALLASWEYGPEQAAAVMRGWRDLAATAPREATFTADLGAGDSVHVGFVWAGGDPARAAGLVADLRSLGRPLAEDVRALPYLDLQTKDDVVGGHAYRRYSKGHYLPAFPDAAIDAFLSRGGLAPGRAPSAGLQAHGGAIAEVDPDAAAFSHRNVMFEYGAGVRWTDPAEDHARMALARQAAAALDPYAAGVYVNALADEGAAGVRRAYPAAKLARLRSVKRAYDPDNTFRMNHNIQPA